MRNLRRAAQEMDEMRSADLIRQHHDVWDELASGGWVPYADICRTESRIVVRVELPGVAGADVRIEFAEGVLRVSGVKRESRRHRIERYLCMERRYGRFERSLPIDWIVNPRRARAWLDRGILTVELPRLRNRPGTVVIPLGSGKRP
jgi:HSP20 family protein